MPPSKHTCSICDEATSNSRTSPSLYPTASWAATGFSAAQLGRQAAAVLPLTVAVLPAVSWKSCWWVAASQMRTLPSVEVVTYSLRLHNSNEGTSGVHTKQCRTAVTIQSLTRLASQATGNRADTPLCLQILRH